MTPATLVADTTAAFLIAVPVVTIYHVFTGRIWLAGLLFERNPQGRMVYSPARLQLLLVTLMGAVQYLLHFIQKPTEMPDIGGWNLLGLGSSQALFLASKAWTAIQARAFQAPKI